MGLLNFIKAKKVIKNWSEKSIVIFSEGKIYYTTNKPVIDELIKDIDVLYITIEKDDELLLFNYAKFHPVYLEFDFWGQLLMATIKGKLFITTTPSLNILALRKSLNMKHYMYIMHAPVDIHSYQKNSFDYFDSIVCIGEFQKNNLLILEEKRKLHCKEKVVLGLPYADLYSKEMAQYKTEKSDSVLIAPSWGDNNFLNYIDYDIFDILLKSGRKVIYRPHPMSFKYEPKQISDIEQQYMDNDNFSIDKNVSGIKSFYKSNIMISAISGVIIDYIMCKPSHVIIIDIPERKCENLELNYLTTSSWENQLFNDICLIVKNENEFKTSLEHLSQISIDKIESYRSNIVNYACASDKIAQYIIEKYKTI